ncbi:MAG: chemotaxis response regulator protein-glutamate methylesterase, partial [Candidatus Zixiibacteriota bacterium]
MSDKIRVLIVDDSAFMRKAIQMMLKDDPLIEIVGFASNGKEGVEKAFELKPDLVTMDIEMPLLDGLTALRMIMEKQPTPVIMVSSLTSEGAQITLDALDLGAVDFIAKQMSLVSLDMVKIKADLQAKVRHIHGRRHTLMAQYALRKGHRIGRTSIRGAQTSQPAMLHTPRKKHKVVRIVSIGTSTGGPPALQAVLTALPRNFPVGIVVVQHMPPMFTKSLSERLNNLCQITVKEAEDGEQINPGTAYIAPGDKHLLVRKNLSKNVAQLSEKPTDTPHKPSVDVLMNSVADAIGQVSLGVIMTGMGVDGLQGLRAMKGKGADIIAQNEESCIVYGMPRAVIEAGIADTIAPL